MANLKLNCGSLMLYQFPKGFCIMKLNVLFVGNSLLHHAPYDEVSWTGDWGMAASCPEKDYYHIVRKKLCAKYSDIEFNFAENGSFSLERGITKSDTEDYSNLLSQMFEKSLSNMTPDIVALQLGDNCPHESTTDTAYAHAMIETVNFFKSKNQNVTIILCLPWFGEMIDSKHIGTLIAARKTEMPFVDLNKHSLPENMALGLFKHDGVQRHPGNRGMELVALEYEKAISDIIDKKFK